MYDKNSIVENCRKNLITALLGLYQYLAAQASQAQEFYFAKYSRVSRWALFFTS
jgi:hypothetical protein